MRIDLHAHTTASDGTSTPRELVAEAVCAGLDVVAITDHDTTAGWQEAAEAVRATGRPLTLVRGMEWSCTARGGDASGSVSVHLLCYLFDPQAPAVTAETERLRGERARRLRVMAERMAAAGLGIDVEALFAEPDGVPGRPHLARALVAAGAADSVAAAFEGPLRSTGPYYEPKRDTPVAEAVRAVYRAGGVTVLAHPRARARGRLMDMEQIGELAESGLGGLEIDHTDHDRRDRDYLRGLARETGLLSTGSSDFHGANKTVRLGAERTAPDQYTEIVGRATGAAVVRSAGAGRDGGA